MRTTGIDNGNIIDLILFDFAKAFDTVNHQILLTKLQYIGIEGTVLSRIKAFLTNRSMKVVVAGSSSSSLSVNSGVPQGSSSLLFLIYVNHISSDLHSNVHIFADDLKLYLLIRPTYLSSALVDISVVQRDINTLIAVAESWDLRVNASKTKVISFGAHLCNTLDLGSFSSYQIKGNPLHISPKVVDLDITVDSNLRYHDDIHCCIQSSWFNQQPAKSTLCRSPDFTFTLLITHIRPLLLEFGSTV